MQLPNAAPAATVLSVTVQDDETADWLFSAAAVNVQNPAALVVDAIGATSTTLLSSGAVRASYPGSVMGTGDPWSIAAGGSVRFAGGQLVAAGSGLTT